MGLLDNLLGRLAANGAQPGQNALVTVALQLIEQNGGLGGILSKFEHGGMAEEVGSWIGTGANMPIRGVVEGVTEFLPVSSTGHLIVTGSLLDYTGEKAKLFEIVIQAGAILAVCWEYRAKLFAVATGIFRDRGAQRFVLNLLIAFLP